MSLFIHLKREHTQNKTCVKHILPSSLCLSDHARGPLQLRGLRVLAEDAEAGQHLAGCDKHNFENEKPKRKRKRGKGGRQAEGLAGCRYTYIIIIIIIIIIIVDNVIIIMILMIVCMLTIITTILTIVSLLLLLLLSLYIHTKDYIYIYLYIYIYIYIYTYIGQHLRDVWVVTTPWRDEHQLCARSLHGSYWILCRGGCSGRGVQWMGVVLHNRTAYNLM